MDVDIDVDLDADDQSFFFDTARVYPGPDPPALYLSEGLLQSTSRQRPIASTIVPGPALPYITNTACLNQSFAGESNAALRVMK